MTDQMGGAMLNSAHNQRLFKNQPKDGCLLPMNYQDFRIINSKGIDYYMIDLRNTDINMVMDIIDECAIVEQECWKAQENFHDYIQKCDMLSYAVINNRIVGFCAGTLFFHDSICIYSNDETMVLRKFRNRNIARNMVFANMRWGLMNRSFKGIKHFVFMSISGNPRIINGYYKHSYLIKILFDCSFKASDKLIEAFNAFRDRYRMALVHEAYPFCVQNLFPGSNTFDPEDERFKFLVKVKNSMPDDFDPVERGDAFAFLVKVPTSFTRAFVTFLMSFAFGKKFFSRRGIGLFAGAAIHSGGSEVEKIPASYVKS